MMGGVDTVDGVDKVDDRPKTEAQTRNSQLACTTRNPNLTTRNAHVI